VASNDIRFGKDNALRFARSLEGESRADYNRLKGVRRDGRLRIVEDDWFEVVSRFGRRRFVDNDRFEVVDRLRRSGGCNRRKQMR
jgi:hypothetical protein